MLKKIYMNKAESAGFIRGIFTDLLSVLKHGNTDEPLPDIYTENQDKITQICRREWLRSFAGGTWMKTI